MICVWGPSCSKYLRRVFGGGGGKVTGARVIRRECRRPLSPCPLPKPLAKAAEKTDHPVNQEPGRLPMGLITPLPLPFRCFHLSIVSQIHSPIPFIAKSLGCVNLYFEECHLLWHDLCLYWVVSSSSSPPWVVPPNPINQIQYLFTHSSHKLCTCPSMLQFATEFY